MKTAMSKSGREYAVGTLVVMFKEGVSEEKIAAFVAVGGLTVLQRMRRIGVYVLGVPEGQEEALVEKFKADPDVLTVDLNSVSHLN